MDVLKIVIMINKIIVWSYNSRRCEDKEAFSLSI